MRRFYFSSAELVPGQQLELPAELQKHLRRVLRLADGAELVLFDGRGHEAQARLGVGASAEILSVSQAPPPAVELTLIQGIAKGEKLDLVLQKGTELGVTHFLLTEMERSVGRLKADRLGGRLERWQKIVQEAARQSGQPYLPQVEYCANLAGAIGVADAELKLLLWEEGHLPLTEQLTQVTPGSVSVIVGPEGGVTKAEAQAALAAGFLAVRLGPRILRTETAGLAIMSVLQYLYGDLGAGQHG